MKRIFAAALCSIAPAALLAGCATTATSTGGGADSAMAAGLTTQPLPASVNTDLPRTARPLHYTIDVIPDAANLSFVGTTTIDMEVFERTDTLVLHALDLTFSAARLLPVDGSGTIVPLRTRVDADAQTVTLTAPRAIDPGRYRVDLSYAGIINTQANGLFALDYPDKRTGQQVRGLFTQFEAPDARRFAPMFDEPSYKATFDLSATVPTGQMALSNMPVAAEQDLGNGTKRVTFRTSPKMSSYLLFFGLGDFERVTKQAAGGTEVGIVAPTGSGSQSQYALDTLAPMVGYYNDYFGVNYPLPKLDNIAGPGESQFFGAMENWGAVFTFERILLEDPAIASAASRQQLYTTQAHEVAHQWFGDIVTMAWWDDLWLNEGFASWMETKATDHFNPQWHALLSRVGGREAAMGLDSLVSTHPVVQPIRTVSETNQAFDAIAYQKGEAVIAMLEAFAGEDVWRQGIRGYMAEHQYGNTVSDDLWSAVEGAGATGLTDIAHDFTRQPGVPLVMAEATCTDGRTRLSLSQSEFSRDRREAVAANPTRWRVPLNVQVGTAAPVREVLQGQTTMVLPGCGPVIVNGGQLGYFRTLYSAPMVAELARGMARLQPIDQLGLMRDNWSLAQAGYQPVGPALDLLAAIPADANPVVTESAVSRWGAAYDLLETEADKTRLRNLAVAKYLPVLRRMGWEQRAADTVAEANLRSELISVLGNMGEPTVLAEGNRLFAALATNPKALDGPLKATWLALTARNATPEQWELLARLASTSGSTVERQTYYQRLGAVADEALARRALALSLSGEAGTSSARIISAVASEHPELAYDFAIENRAAVEKLVDNSARARYFAGLASASQDPAIIGKLRTLRAATPADEQVPIDRVIGGIEQQLEANPRMREQISGWLRLEAR
ncbi:M1 family metallopeptidase [Croceibacterium ferulae]|uniref:M1 family metallopeptidase n=1 Tax=Croceibacterium ferulae TaxID=1854641 RepID=UPI00138FD31C|nr:M1 family metallopeptidase [Croceibacterium ferulae]